MLKKLVFVGLVVVLTLGACVGNNPIATVPAQMEITIAPTQTQTFTPEPSSTPSLTPTITATATVTSTATATPENLALADSGYDIADVRITYPRADIAVITFKYQIDSTNTSKTNVIGLLPASLCEGAYTPGDILDPGLLFHVNNFSGSGRLIYRQTSQGECSAPFFDLNIYSQFKYYETWSINSKIVYQERIDQSLKIVRNLPTINSKTLSIKNFAFQTTGPWSGQFTFDYVFSPDTSDIIGKYRFSLAGMGDALYCDFESTGPLIISLEGTYILGIDLKAGAMRGSGNCLDKYSNIIYYDSELSLVDTIASSIGRSIEVDYQRAIDLPIKLKKMP